jgi:superfamily II DNA or RNA helicase
MLRPHQVEPARHLVEVLRRYPSAVDWSDTGTGKTAVAVAVAKELKLQTLAIVPQISISAWHRMAKLFGDEISVINYEMLRTGKTPFGSWDSLPPRVRPHVYQCVNCQRKYAEAATMDPCYCRPDGIHGVEIKKVPHRYGKFTFHPAVQFIIFDEAHRCGALSSLNADILIAARRQNIKHLTLSATAAFSPLDLRALGYSLDLHHLQDFYNWAIHLGCRRLPVGGFKWMVSRDDQLSVMSQIRDAIIPARGVRVTADSIPDFPEVDIQAELYDLEGSGQIDRLYGEMATALAELEAHRATDKDMEHPLTKILRARQKIELLKVPLMAELCADYRAKGFSVAMFVNFKQTIAELSKRLKCNLIIDGDNIKTRDETISEFQTNRGREIILNINAGKESINLQDVDGNFPRIGLAMPTHSAKAVKQLLGRLPRVGGKSKSFYRFLFAAGTIEVGMHRALVAKLGNLDALNDSDLQPENLQFAS